MRTNKILLLFILMCIIFFSLYIFESYYTSAKQKKHYESREYDAYCFNTDTISKKHSTYFAFLDNKRFLYFSEYQESDRYDIFPFYLFKIMQQYNGHENFFIHFFSTEKTLLLTNNTDLFNTENATNYDCVYTPFIIGGFFLFKNGQLVGFSSEIKQSNIIYLESQLEKYLW